MRICYISNPNSPHTRRWVNWFARHEHQVCLIADTRLNDSWAGLEVFDLPQRFNLPKLRFLVWVYWTRQIIARWKPDILHAHRVSSAGWLGAFSGFHPFVVTPWGSDLFQHPYRSRLACWLAKYTLQSADLVTANSVSLREQAIHFGASPAISHVVRWGIDLSVFSPGEAGDLRQQLGLGSRPVVFSPRGVNPLYNLDVIIEAMPAVLAVQPEAVFVFRDYNTDVGYKALLDQRIQALNLQSSVRWLPFEPTARYVDFYRIARVIVSIPSSDSFPASVQEAMACGVPVIASDLPSLRELITPDENGLLVPARDSGELAKAIIHLLTHPELQQSFSQRNLELVQHTADQHQEMSRMDSLYRALIEAA